MDSLPRASQLQVGLLVLLSMRGWGSGVVCNAGVTLPREVLDRLARMTADAGTWLVIDETYEDFLFSGQKHYCPNAPHVVHVFSFSKVSIRAFNSSGLPFILKRM